MSNDKIPISSVEGLAHILEEMKKDGRKDSDILTRIDVQVEQLVRDVHEMKGGYVTKEAFDPYKKVIMALVLGLIANSIALIYK